MNECIIYIKSIFLFQAHRRFEWIQIQWSSTILLIEIAIRLIEEFGPGIQIKFTLLIFKAIVDVI